ncbi:MAG: hypothetical protein NZ730_09695 [Porticoccaceae bacterium]|nr:hypothetical protein [Porticoccaceae bacterium]
MARIDGILDYLGLGGTDNMSAFGSPAPVAEPLVVNQGNPLQGLVVGSQEYQDAGRALDAKMGIGHAAKEQYPEVHEVLDDVGYDRKPLIDAQTMKRVLAGEISLADAALPHRQLIKTPTVKRGSELARTKGTMTDEALRATEGPSMWDKFKKGAGDYFGDEENMANLAMGFNTMRLNPDQGIASAMAAKAASARKRKGTTKSVKWLRDYAMKQQDPALRQKYMEMAIAAEQNPSMAKDIVDAVMKQAHGVGADMLKTFAPKIDQDGKEYIPVFNPNTNKVERKYTGSTGMTPKEEITFKTNEENRLKDVNRRDTEAAKVFAAAEGISGQINRVEGIISQLEEGAVTGWIANNFPTFNKATAQLEQLANQLGLDIIASVTFGALSEAELKLAMDTAVPRSLGPSELKKWALDKAAAQRKLRNELYSRANELSTSEGYSSFVQQESAKQMEHFKVSWHNLPREMTQALTAKGLSYAQYQQMNFNQRKQLIDQYRK